MRPGECANWNLNGSGDRRRREQGFVDMGGDSAGNGRFSQVENGFRGEEILGIGDVEPAWDSGGVVHEHEGVTGTGEADVEESQVF